MIAAFNRLREFARRHPLVATCLVMTVLTLLANGYLWWERNRITREHAEVLQTGTAMLEAVGDRARIEADVAALGAALEQIERNLATEESMEVNLGYFYRLEKLSRVRLVRIDQLVTPPAPAGAAYKAVPISLQVLGSYRHLLGFVRELESGPRILRVRDYRLERDQEVADLSLHLTVELLARP